MRREAKEHTHSLSHSLSHALAHRGFKDRTKGWGWEGRRRGSGNTVLEVCEWLPGGRSSVRGGSWHLRARASGRLHRLPRFSPRNSFSSHLPHEPRREQTQMEFPFSGWAGENYICPVSLLLFFETSFQPQCRGLVSLLLDLQRGPGALPRSLQARRSTA